MGIKTKNNKASPLKLIKLSYTSAPQPGNSSKICSTKFCSLLHIQHWQYLSNIFTTTDDNKPLWHYIVLSIGDMTTEVGIGTLHTPNSTPVIHPGKKAQLLNEQFRSVFTFIAREDIINSCS